MRPNSSPWPYRTEPFRNLPFPRFGLKKPRHLSLKPYLFRFFKEKRLPYRCKKTPFSVSVWHYCMVAKPVFFTKPVSNRFSVFKNRFQTGFQFSKPVSNRFSVFKTGFKPVSSFQNRFQTGFQFSKPVFSFWNQLQNQFSKPVSKRFQTGFKPVLSFQNRVY